MSKKNDGKSGDGFDNTTNNNNNHFSAREVKIFNEKLSNILLSLGVFPVLKGYHFVRYAIMLVAIDNSLISAVTKKLYPMVADSFDTTPSRVERAIRHALQNATNSGRMVRLNAVVGAKVLQEGECPSNSEFIALLSDRFIIDMLN